MGTAAPAHSFDAFAEVLGVPAERLRAWVRAGLVRPIEMKDGLAQFDFRQAAAAKSLCDMLASGVTLGRVRKSLQSLRTWRTDAEYPLEQLAILERSGTLLVRLEQGDLAGTDGQYHFDFHEDPGYHGLRITGGPHTADEWFAQGMQQEQAGQNAEAVGSYRQALLVGGADADVVFALANVLRTIGQRQQALERYLQVVELDSSNSDGWNNLGLCLSELGSNYEALGAFRRAIDADPENWRARYNLADALDDLADPEAATHWREYLRHDQDSEHAEHATERLRAAARSS